MNNPQNGSIAIPAHGSIRIPIAGRMPAIAVLMFGLITLYCRGLFNRVGGTQRYA